MTCQTTTQRFDRLVPNAGCRLADINEHLLCALCSGYLVDATTIIECLHTFCRSCIIRYLESSETCPVCDVPLHQTNPLLGIRSDTTLQALVYKLVPGVYKDEVRRRCNIINNAHKDGRPAAVMDRLLKEIGDMTTGGTVYAGDEAFSVCLQYYPPPPPPTPPDKTSPANSSRDHSSKDLTAADTCQTPKQDLTDYTYLLCPASLTVAHLKKLIRTKLELSSHLTVELFNSSRDGILHDGYSMADVAYITAWTSIKPLHFLYDVKVKSSKSADERNSAPISATALQSTEKRSKHHHGNSWKKTKSRAVDLPSTGTKPTKVKVKPPPGKCLSTKPLTTATENSVFSSSKNITKKSGKQRYDVTLGNFGAAAADAAEPEMTSEDAERVVLLEDDCRAIQTDTRPVEPEVDTRPVEPEVVRTNGVPTIGGDVTHKNDVIIGKTERGGRCWEENGAADSALSPSRRDVIVTQSTLLPSSDITDGVSENVEMNVIDSATSSSSSSSSCPLPKKKAKLSSDPPASSDRNLFAVINSMIVGKTNNNNNDDDNNNNNDNVVSSSTSSQVSADDSSDSGAQRTSVETQTNVKLISRKAKKGKNRPKRRDTIRPPCFANNNNNNNNNTQRLPTSSSSSSSAHTTCQPVAVTTPHASGSSSSSLIAVTPCPSMTTNTTTTTTVCVPICIGDKSSSLILNLPQNVSVQCRIRSDNILIASSPSTGGASGNPETAPPTSGQNENASRAPDAVTSPQCVLPSSSSFSAEDGFSTTVCPYPKYRSGGTCSTGDTGTGAGTGLDADVPSGGTHATGKNSKLSESCAVKCSPSDKNTHLNTQTLHSDGLELDSDSDQRSRGAGHDSEVKVASPTKLEKQTLPGGHSNGNQATQSNSDDRNMTKSTKPALDDVTRPPKPPNPSTAEYQYPQKPTMKLKPVQPVLPNVSIKSSPAPSSNNNNVAGAPSFSANKIVLFKPYQMVTTTEAKTSRIPSDGLTMGTRGTQYSVHSAPVYSSSSQLFSVFPGCFSYAGPPHPDRMLLSKGWFDRVGAQEGPRVGSAMHCTAGNVPLRNVIKVPVYTATCNRARVNRKTDKKPIQCLGSTPMIPKDPERGGGGGGGTREDARGVPAMAEDPVLSGSEKIRKTSHPQDVDAVKSPSASEEERSGTKTTPLRSGLKLPLTSVVHSFAISTPGGGDRGAAPLAVDSQTTRKRPHLPETRRRSEKSPPPLSLPLDEMTYTKAEADSGTSPGASGASSPPRCGEGGRQQQRAENTAPVTAHHRRSTGNNNNNNSPVRTKLVADPDPERSRSPCQGSPTTTLHPGTTTDLRSGGGKKTEPQKPSNQRSQVTPSGIIGSVNPAQGLPPASHWSPPSSTSSCADNSSPPPLAPPPPPTTKRLKLMCNGMTIYRTLESPGSRSRNLGGVESGTRKSSSSTSTVLLGPGTVPAAAKTTTSPATKSRRRSIGGPAAVLVGGEPSVLVRVDSTSTSPRSASVRGTLGSSDDVVTSWKGLGRSVSLPDHPDCIMDAPLELTTTAVKERQKEREFEKQLLSTLRPHSAFTT